MKKKTFLVLLIGLMAYFPSSSFAQTNGYPPIDPHGRPNLLPSRLSFIAYYDEDSNIFVLNFRRSIPQATLYIYKNGCLIVEDEIVDNIAGTTINYPIAEYGPGIYTFYLMIGDRTYTLQELIIE